MEQWRVWREGLGKNSMTWQRPLDWWMVNQTHSGQVQSSLLADVGPNVMWLTGTILTLRTEAKIPGPNQSWARPLEATLGGASGCRGCEVSRQFVKSSETDDSQGLNRACVTLMRAISQTGRLIQVLVIVTNQAGRIKLFVVWPVSWAEFSLSIPESWAGTRVCCSSPRRAGGWRTETLGRRGWSRGLARDLGRDLRERGHNF